MTLKLSNEADIERLAFDLTSMSMRYDRWLQTALTKIVEEEILVPIWESMKAHNYSQKIIDGTDIEVIIRKGKKVTIRIVSKYKTEGGFDVAKGREYGTADHWIEPKMGDPTALRDPKTGATSQYPTKEQIKKSTGKKALHWVNKWGEEFFSKGHITGGIEQKMIVSRAVAFGTGKVRQRVKDDFKKWRNDILNI